MDRVAGRAGIGGLALVVCLSATAEAAFWLPSSLGLNVPTRLVAVGDSITQGVLGGPCDSPCIAEQPYPAVLQALLSPPYPGYTVLNRGVGGETTAGGRARLPQVLQTDRPAVVLIMEGTNDATFERSPDQIVDNLRAMVQAAKTNLSIPILGAIPPNFRPSGIQNSDEAREIIDAVNARLRTVATEEGVRFVEVFAALFDSGLFGDDRLHPTPAGYEVLARAWLEAAGDAILDALTLSPRAYLLGVNAERFHPGERLTVDLTVIDDSAPAVGDVYFGVLLPAEAGAPLGCPAGDAVAFLTEAFTEVVLRCLGDSPDAFVPLYPFPVELSAPLPLTRVLGVWSLDWSAEFPAGEYTLFFVLTPPGDPTRFLASAIHRLTLTR